MGDTIPRDTRWVVERADLHQLFDALRADGYALVGPTLRDGAVVYDTIDCPDDLPAGWTDHQDAGRYRLERRADQALFGYAVGPHAWKRFLHPSRQRLWRAQREDTGFRIEPAIHDVPRYAFVGVRSCELRAIAIQDRVLIGDRYQDPEYRSRREAAFLLAVNCAEPAGTCFCVSMQAGPAVHSGFDLALTELIDAQRHAFVVQTGSERGAGVLARVPHREASAEERAAADAVTVRAVQHMGRELRTDGLPALLMRNLEHSRWDDAAVRCLACANCTMVCPTCFCTGVEDVTDLSGNVAERVRRWDSCFTTQFSYLHGGAVRGSVASRYRQWLTHKLAGWADQFGSLGCVGCGRCITWCPAGIDLTQEASAIQATDGAGKGGGHGRT